MTPRGSQRSHSLLSTHYSLLQLCQRVLNSQKTFFDILHTVRKRNANAIVITERTARYSGYMSFVEKVHDKIRRIVNCRLTVAFSKVSFHDGKNIESAI